jgi:hypothetical protein
LGYSLSFAQTQVAKLDLVFEKRFEDGTVRLSKFEADGLMDLSSSSGPGKYVSGGNIKEVFSNLFPSVEFKVGKQLLGDYYRLEITDFSELNNDVLNRIWDAFNKNKLFNAKESSKTIEGYCISIENRSVLDKHIYVSKNGIKSMDNSKGKQIDLSGYTLLGLVNKLNNNFKPIFFLEPTSYTNSFSFKFSVANEQTILNTFSSYGLKYFECQRVNTTFYLD